MVIYPSFGLFGGEARRQTGALNNAGGSGRSWSRSSSCITISVVVLVVSIQINVQHAFYNSRHQTEAQQTEPEAATVAPRPPSSPSTPQMQSRPSAASRGDGGGVQTSGGGGSPTCDPVKEFHCKLENRCIPLEWHCDFQEQCLDGQDELGCLPERCDFEHDHCYWLNSLTSTKDNGYQSGVSSLGHHQQQHQKGNNSHGFEHREQKASESLVVGHDFWRRYSGASLRSRTRRGAANDRRDQLRGASAAGRPTQGPSIAMLLEELSSGLADRSKFIFVPMTWRRPPPLQSPKASQQHPAATPSNNQTHPRLGPPTPTRPHHEYPIIQAGPGAGADISQAEHNNNNNNGDSDNNNNNNNYKQDHHHSWWRRHAEIKTPTIGRTSNSCQLRFEYTIWPSAGVTGPGLGGSILSTATTNLRLVAHYHGQHQYRRPSQDYSNQTGPGNEENLLGHHDSGGDGELPSVSSSRVIWARQVVWAPSSPAAPLSPPRTERPVALNGLAKETTGRLAAADYTQTGAGEHNTPYTTAGVSTAADWTVGVAELGHLELFQLSFEAETIVSPALETHKRQGQQPMPMAKPIPVPMPATESQSPLARQASVNDESSQRKVVVAMGAATSTTKGPLSGALVGNAGASGGGAGGGSGGGGIGWHNSKSTAGATGKIATINNHAPLKTAPSLQPPPPFEGVLVALRWLEFHGCHDWPRGAANYLRENKFAPSPRGGEPPIGPPSSQAAAAEATPVAATSNNNEPKKATARGQGNWRPAARQQQHQQLLERTASPPELVGDGPQHVGETTGGGGQPNEDEQGGRQLNKEYDYGEDDDDAETVEWPLDHVDQNNNNNNDYDYNGRDGQDGALELESQEEAQEEAPCLRDEFQCVTGSCLPNRLLCNYVDECISLNWQAASQWEWDDGRPKPIISEDELDELCKPVLGRENFELKPGRVDEHGQHEQDHDDQLPNNTQASRQRQPEQMQLFSTGRQGKFWHLTGSWPADKVTVRRATPPNDDVVLLPTSSSNSGGHSGDSSHWLPQHDHTYQLGSGHYLNLELVPPPAPPTNNGLAPAVLVTYYWASISSQWMQKLSPQVYGECRLKFFYNLVSAQVAKAAAAGAETEALSGTTGSTVPKVRIAIEHLTLSEARNSTNTDQSQQQQQQKYWPFGRPRSQLVKTVDTLLHSDKELEYSRLTSRDHSHSPIELAGVDFWREVNLPVEGLNEGDYFQLRLVIYVQFETTAAARGERQHYQHHESRESHEPNNAEPQQAWGSVSIDDLATHFGCGPIEDQAQLARLNEMASHFWQGTLFNPSDYVRPPPVSASLAPVPAPAAAPIVRAPPARKHKWEYFGPSSKTFGWRQGGKSSGPGATIDGDGDSRRSPAGHLQQIEPQKLIVYVLGAVCLIIGLIAMIVFVMVPRVERAMMQHHNQIQLSLSGEISDIPESQLSNTGRFYSISQQAGAGGPLSARLAAADADGYYLTSETHFGDGPDGSGGGGLHSAGSLRSDESDASGGTSFNAPASSSDWGPCEPPGAYGSMAKRRGRAASCEAKVREWKTSSLVLDAQEEEEDGDGDGYGEHNRQQLGRIGRQSVSSAGSFKSVCFPAGGKRRDNNENENNNNNDEDADD